ncbi:hypothetical protein N7457_004513 [Penicillium paradoxum]|uniref:uncharacterized protein n=1 Tax=Penicillium paradoxum TaxID=176176 RepID=UPI0025473048|nr:uncharacterized protein N7457_004513 [Penicillium paradoxum]KAJ5782739.1 hypothetical protein N7457_004513 [Penicillium paradoxum]
MARRKSKQRKPVNVLPIIFPGDGRTGDATKFNIFKQNYYNLRYSTPKFLGRSIGQVDDGVSVDNYSYSCTLANATTGSSDLSKGIQACHKSEDCYRYEIWFSDHRNGESRINNSNTDNTNTWHIHQQIQSDSKYLSDDTRFWVDVQAI